ncbi:MAG: type II toxin-antitoxin system prevent-host-death family antitoxin [Gemmatimonadota bacterium]|uniref:type II toxin-antitoxin system Phd/YefM family antitoxin n=1 Tax=Candidatus Palauibacter scopulicola TaxID=3056741 RepID=UPI0023A4C161|nr:type II toxin-antitoxin system prevent-host-death family antitoxin [Candidatus Palauibacter scopulicola]MDE2663000.1 type II toxin-antitoxin system prevent-host-death family antitoxin [Candidatus Palauibacter scopulicola]
MRTFEIHEARRHLSRLVQEAVDGDPFVITRDGRPLVEVVSINTPELAGARRTGFMAGEIAVPPDFDRMGSTEIESLFDADP